MPEAEITKRTTRLIKDTDKLVQDVKKGVSGILADALSLKESLDEIRERFEKPEEKDE